MNSPVPVTQPLLLRALAGETLPRPPIWFMRQAGRYLPEYRELRTQAKDFLSLCFDPQMAAEVTLQPMRRFAFDGAIVFADILLIPGALGQKVWFEAGEGPRLGPLPSNEALRAELDASTERLASIGETLRLVRAELEPDRALIGFAGGPWTVATYMIEGRSSDRTGARTFAFTHPEVLDEMLDEPLAPESLKEIMSVRREYLQAALDVINQDYGSVDAYLERTANLTPERRKALQAQLLE